MAWESFRRAPLAIAFLVLWIAAVIASQAVSSGEEAGPTTCKLRAVTGVPCPTCGGTRSTFSLFRGDISGAIAHNPWIVGMHLCVVISLLAMLLRRPRWNIISRLSRQPKIAVPLLLISLGLNWIYVLRTQ